MRYTNWSAVKSEIVETIKDLKNDELIKNDRIAVIFENKMTEIEQILNDGMALRNISDADPLCHNDYECHHQIVILFKAVNDAAPWYL